MFSRNFLASLYSYLLHMPDNYIKGEESMKQEKWQRMKLEMVCKLAVKCKKTETFNDIATCF